MFAFLTGLLLWLALLVGVWVRVGRSLVVSEPDDDPAADRVSSMLVLAVGLGLMNLAISALPTNAQPVQTPDTLRTVDLDGALRLFRANNLSLRRARAEVQALRGEAQQSAAYPNPRLQATHEPLWRNGTRVSETYLNVTQPIAWSGRAARIEARRQQVDAVRARAQSDSLRLAADVATAYVDAAAATLRRRRLEQVTRVFRRADSSFAAREAEGKASGYARRRVRLERARYEQRLAAARLEVRSARERLALLILPDAVSVVGTRGLPDAMPPRISRREAQRTARRQRPELERWRAEVEAQESAVTAARREAWPDPSVTAGYKQQSDGFEGAFLGLSLPLPLFDRNRGAAQAEAARLDVAETQRALVQREIRADVRRAHTAYRSARRQMELVGDGLMARSDDLLRIAQTSYREGEMSLVELLDAADAYRDARLTRVDLRADLWSRYVRLQAAMGRPIARP